MQKGELPTVQVQLSLKHFSETVIAVCSELSNRNRTICKNRISHEGVKRKLLCQRNFQSNM